MNGGFYGRMPLDGSKRAKDQAYFEGCFLAKA